MALERTPGQESISSVLVKGIQIAGIFVFTITIAVLLVDTLVKANSAEYEQYGYYDSGVLDEYIADSDSADPIDIGEEIEHNAIGELQ